MARVTVEDCVKKIPNRFDLVIAASQRSREISNGVAIEVDRDNDKNPVVSLREIASEAIDAESLQERFIRSISFPGYPGPKVKIGKYKYTLIESDIEFYKKIMIKAYE